MISLLIGSLILAGVLYTASGTSGTGRKMDANSQMAENGQIALQLLADNVRWAGYSETVAYYAPGQINTKFALAGLVGCDTLFSNVKSSGHAASLDLLECDAPEENESINSSFAVAYQVDNYNAMLVSSDATTSGFAPADCRGYGLEGAPGALGGVGNALNSTAEKTTDGQPVETDENTYYWRVENRFYVGADTDGTPSLKCTGIGDPSFVGESTLVRGVERMVVTYGVAAEEASAPEDSPAQDISAPDMLILRPDVVNYLTAEQINSTWSDETPQMRWQRAISVRICLELVGGAGSADTTGEGVQGSFINCEGQSTNITDGKLRRTVSQVVSVRNRTAVPKNGKLGYGGV